MISLHVAVSEKGIIDSIKSGLSADFVISESFSKDEALSVLKKKRHDLFFIDLTLLQESIEDNNKDILKPFFNLYPTMPIVVISPIEKIRYAVDLVKMGARDYLNYPINHEELRYVIESIRDSMIVRSELDYLRDEFWGSEWLDTVHTNSARI